MSEISWNRDSLSRLVKSELGDSLLIVVSNREPYVHSASGGKISWNRPVSGLTEALDPVMRASKGIWIAHGSGEANHGPDEHQGQTIPVRPTACGHWNHTPPFDAGSQLEGRQ